MQYFTPPKLDKYLNPAALTLIIIGIVVVILLATSVYIVDQTEEAVITRFGRYIYTKGPGLQFKLPFGIDKNYTVNVKTVQTQEFGFRSVRGGSSPTYSNQASFPVAQYAAQTGESTMLTGDLNIVEVEWIIQYRIVDPKAWTFNVNERVATIRDVSRSAINMLVGDRAIMDIMGAERSAIEAAGMDFMNETLRGYGLGINVIAVRLQNIVPPAGVQQAFEDVNKAMQDMERLMNEGMEEYNREIPKAGGERDRLIQSAQGYAAERVNRANGDVARYNSVYAEYRRSPEVTRQRLYYEMVEEVFKEEEGTVIIDRNLRNFLPLMNLQGGSR
ncbi:MAG: FtsH protease activity modulator HflK [Treponema sp.]|jgi:membrane protease subunit HflK|nr:FtsH protease activity modulator HflK [Treponema sp.]